MHNGYSAMKWKTYSKQNIGCLAALWNSALAATVVGLLVVLSSLRQLQKLILFSQKYKEVAHNGLQTPQDAGQDFRNEVGKNYHG